MKIITIDFETFYDVGYGLNKLTTEEYINDPRFQVIGFGVKVNGGPTKWYTGTHEELKEKLNYYKLQDNAVLCHNMMFDGAILAFKFNIVPKVYFDTLCMARAYHGINAGGSLKALAERYQLGQKGTEVLDAKGKRLEDFDSEELYRYGQYCINDVELTYKLFNILSKDYPPGELKLIDLTIRMFTQPQLKVDDALLIDRLAEVKEEKQNLLSGLKAKLKCETEEEVRKKLASNKQFAELLEKLGVTVPMKESPTTGKPTYALAKTDQGFIDLQNHEDSLIQELCAVRLGTKSTIEESRIERFIDIGARNEGRLPIPLKYYGAHTGRWSGSDKVNFQNLPSRDAKKKALKQAVLPPEGYVCINVDSSQIEARILVWLAGQDDVTQWYREGRDVYCEFASKVYNKKITKKEKTERAVGKTCILGLGYGTGALKLQNVLKLGAGVEFDEDECRRLVNIYREVNNKVIDLWQECDNALADIASWPEDKEPYYIGEGECVMVTPEGIKLPNGLYIYYPDLEWDTSETKSRYTYKRRHGRVGIWGGSVVENIVQALARIVIGEQMTVISHKYRPALTVHDAVVCIAAEEEKDEALNYIMAEMSKPPGWAKDCPITCEGGYADNYGDC
jgi:DNA polymerase